MTNAPDSRKTHVTRIFGTNKKKEVLQDIWADVERMDVIKSAMQIPPDRQWQGMQRKLLWCDDPNADDYAPDGTPSRLTEVLKVCDPENTEDVNDPEEWIPLRVIKGMKSQGGSGEGEGFMDRFLNAVLNEELQTAREVEVRRIVHYDTNIDKEVQSAVDADPTLKEYVVAGDNYTRDDVTKDTAQYVEHEIATHLKHKGNTLASQAMGRQTKLLNDYLIDESETATGEITGDNGINPPYRLDPFQNIVNVNWGGDNFVVAVDTFNAVVWWSDDCKTFHRIPGFLFLGPVNPDTTDPFPTPSNVGIIWCIAYVKTSKTFVIAGEEQNYYPTEFPEIHFANNNPKMMSSEDGKTWERLSFPGDSLGTSGVFEEPSWAAFGLRYDPPEKGKKDADRRLVAVITAGGPPQPGDMSIQSKDGTSWGSGGSFVPASMNARDYWPAVSGGGCKLRVAATMSSTYGPGGPNSDGTMSGVPKLERSIDGGETYSVIDTGYTITSRVVRSNGVFLVGAASDSETLLIKSTDGLEWEPAFSTELPRSDAPGTRSAGFYCLASGRLPKPT